MAEHNYVRKIRQFAREHNLPPGRLIELATLHDNWCGFNRGRRCDCDPEIRFLEGVKIAPDILSN